MGPRLRCKHSWIHLGELCTVPWVPEVFLACGGNFRCWPKANFGRRPKPRAATALEKSLAPRLCVRWLATCFAALLRNGFKSYVALFTTYVQTCLHKACCCKLRDYWLLIFSQPPTTFWFVSRQASLIREWSNAQHRHSTVARFAAVMLQNRSHVFVACFRCTFTWRLAFWLRLCSHHNG